MSRAAEIEITAADWLRRREELHWSDADQADLEAWLDASMAHKAAYWRLEYGWRMADRIGAMGPAALSPTPRGIGKYWIRWRYAALAASLCATAILSILLLTTPERTSVVISSFHTRVGGHRVVPLADGSRIELNTGTRLRTEISVRSREVWLDRGEAYFEVAHLENSTFVVHAGSRTVKVLGTKFSVRRDGEAVRVTVVEGRVQINDSTPRTIAASTIATRGEVALAREGSTLVTARSVQQVKDELAWRDGRLIFDQTTLANAADEFNRYNRVQLAITDPTIAAIRIGGTFQSSNVEAFVRLLEEAYGLNVKRRGEQITISS